MTSDRPPEGNKIPWLTSPIQGIREMCESTPEMDSILENHGKKQPLIMGNISLKIQDHQVTPSTNNRGKYVLSNIAKEGE